MSLFFAGCCQSAILVVTALPGKSNILLKGWSTMKRILISVLTPLLLALSIPACALFTNTVVLTADDLKQRGTRTFQGVSRDTAVEGAAVALGTLGYYVTQKNLETGVVRTAPREILTTASTNTTHHDRSIVNPQYTSESSSTVTRDELAWSLRVVADSEAEVTIIATPRAYRNGTELAGENTFIAEVMDPRFNDLWRAVEEVIGTP